MPDFASILEEVKGIIADVLALEPEEVTPDARFREDLGGESIDFLDLSFQCEKRFGVNAGLQKLASPDEYPIEESGRFTQQAVAKFKSRYPFLDYKDIDENPTPDRIMSLFTVENIARFVESSLATQSG
jgi:acyl carrier protein